MRGTRCWEFGDQIHSVSRSGHPTAGRRGSVLVKERSESEKAKIRQRWQSRRRARAHREWREKKKILLDLMMHPHKASEEERRILGRF